MTVSRDRICISTFPGNLVALFVRLIESAYLHHRLFSKLRIQGKSHNMRGFRQWLCCVANLVCRANGGVLRLICGCTGLRAALSDGESFVQLTRGFKMDCSPRFTAFSAMQLKVEPLFTQAALPTLSTTRQLSINSPLGAVWIPHSTNTSQINNSLSDKQIKLKNARIQERSRHPRRNRPRRHLLYYSSPKM